MNVVNPTSPILVTGSHRSGSTWIGRMLSHSPDIGYIHEPFNLQHMPGICRAKFDYWYTYICNENSSEYKSALQDTLLFNYSISDEIRNIKTPYQLFRAIYYWSEFGRYRRKGLRPLVKDPIALLSSEWLASQFDMKIIVIIRHPAAFAGSLKKANWSHPFDHFTRQPLLMRDYLQPFEEEIKLFSKNKMDVIEQACLLWNIFHYVIREFQTLHPDWIYIRHEDLSANPVSGFRALADRLSVTFNEKMERLIRQYSDSAGNAESQNLSEIKRNSSENIKSWKQRLTDREIEKVRIKTEAVSGQFYSDTDW